MTFFTPSIVLIKFSKSFETRLSSGSLSVESAMSLILTGLPVGGHFCSLLVSSESPCVRRGVSFLINIFSRSWLVLSPLDLRSAVSVSSIKIVIFSSPIVKALSLISGNPSNRFSRGIPSVCIFWSSDDCLVPGGAMILKKTY